MTNKAFDLLFEIITQPVTENGVFKKEYMEQEAKNLKELIESRVNDKVQYGVDKCLEIMCEKEPFGIFDYGNIEDINKIDAAGLYDHYKYFLETLPVYVFIFGDINDEQTNYIIDKLKKIKRGNIKTLPWVNVERHVSEVREITEHMNVNQAKLSIGFRTNTDPKSEDYYKLMVYNSILGGGLHSKLFQNVREKNGLAYYVFSRLEKFKGLMVISSGIEIGNRDKAYDVVMKQLEDMKNGVISDYEFEASIKSIETGVNSLKDSQLQVVDFNLSQIIAGTHDSPDDIIGKVRKVTRQDVIDIAKKIEMDTVFFLTSK
ncbi:MAG: Peptidase M16 inactive domain protein [Firmicutes bacterium ADurb.Bin419]|nr:MAG: Peptidase M16 inactive domain protein [Firmicutes bacterium ADurb.Bin419]